jgi:hypothetical protein
MLCALTVRQLKPGSFDEFQERFTPEGGAPAGWVRFDMLRNTSNPDQVVTFGFFDGTMEELSASQDEHDYEDRIQAVDDIVETVVSNGIYEIVAEFTSA